MQNDFYIALLFGWLILLVFWSIIIVFIYIRKPPYSKLTVKVIVNSYLIFLVLLIFILLLRYGDSFL